MWPLTFSDRLESWNLLRTRCATLPTESALQQINSWWFSVPWRPYYLHWDDQTTWPDPWQLLSDDIYCDIARGLGILYTITLLDRVDLASARLVLTHEGYNLVLVSKEKYILNWEPNTIVNTFQEVKIHQQYQQQQIA
jgi:hypothetical protein